jgi:aspartyl-tRNA(Asn)/glutamyl-tRNA(Gln) amidotransferase subunit C
MGFQSTNFKPHLTSKMPSNLGLKSLTLLLEVIQCYNIVMSVSKSDVAHLAALSSISLSDDELAALAVDIENIVKYIEQLQELDTSGVEPTFQLTGLSNVWREDEITPQLAREKLLALAPDAKNNQMKVPKVL